MFYLTTHSTHFILWLYDVGHLVKDHSDRDRGNPLPPHGFFYMHHPTDRIAYTTAFVTPVMEHWLEREIPIWDHHEGSIRRPIAPWANALTTELHLAPTSDKIVWDLSCEHSGHDMCANPWYSHDVHVQYGDLILTTSFCCRPRSVQTEPVS